MDFTPTHYCQFSKRLISSLWHLQKFTLIANGVPLDMWLSCPLQNIRIYYPFLRDRGFTDKGRYWIERGPTDKDGPGFVYAMSEVGADIPYCYKIGFTKLDPEDRVAQLAKTNRMSYKLEYNVKVKYRKNTEKVLLEDLRARGKGLPRRELQCGKNAAGGTEWVCGQDVIEIVTHLLELIKQLDRKGSRYRKK